MANWAHSPLFISRVAGTSRLKPLRVLVLTPDFPPAFGGIQQLMHGLVQNSAGMQVRVVTNWIDGSEAIDEHLPCQIRRVGRGLLGHRAKVAHLNLAALNESRRFRPDVVLNGHIVTGPAAAIIHRISGVPYVQYAYGKELASRKRLARLAIRGAAAVVPISSYTRELVRLTAGSLGIVRLIPPGVDIQKNHPNGRSQQAEILTVSRLTETYKGHDVMVSAIPLIKARVPQVRWVVIGDGPLRREYEARIQSTGLHGEVEFLGAVSDREKNARFERAAVFAMPSRQSPNGSGDGFGIVYLEAAAHGVPVVAGNIAGARDAVVDGVTGMLVDPEDHVALANAIADLLLEPERARAMGQAGFERAQEFAWPRIAERVKAVLREVAGTRAA